MFMFEYLYKCTYVCACACIYDWMCVCRSVCLFLFKEIKGVVEIQSEFLTYFLSNLSKLLEVISVPYNFLGGRPITLTSVKPK